MQRCPIEGCGRQFQNQLTMIEHVKRRHPIESQKIKQKTMNEMMQKQNKINEQMNKLPKMQKIIQMSKQKKGVQFQRRSASKKRKQLVNIIQNSQIKLNDIITESRQLVDQNNNTNSRKLLRPSLSKKTSQQTDNKLPSLNQVKPKKLKLQNLKSQFNQTTIGKQSVTIFNKNHEIPAQTQNHMYSTAPNFAHQMAKKIQTLRSRSKGKDKQLQGQISNRSSSKDLNTIQTKDVLHKKTISSHSKLSIGQNSLITTQKVVDQKQKPIQRPIKKLLERSSIKKQKQATNLVTQPLSQSVYIQKPSQIVQKPKSKSKQLSFSSLKNNQQNRFSKKQTPLHSPSSASTEAEQWKQKTVTIRNKNLPYLSIPDDSQVQYLFVTNCQVKQVNLNQCFSLIQLSLTNNKLQNLQFLQQTLNGGYQNLQAIYLDNNNISSLSSLPTYLRLKRLSFTFNKISDLDETIKILVKFPLLQELDFSFNPIRKQNNYKLAIISVCRNLKKLDGMVITKFDRQLADEYHKMYYQNLNIIPLSNNNSKPLDNSRTSSYDDKYRPSTAVSINYQKDLQSSNINEPDYDLTDEQLQKQISKLQKLIKNTKQQFEIIQRQNQVLEEQISNNEPSLQEQEQKQQFNPKLYKKLTKQCEELQLLNFFTYATQKQLEDLLVKKAKEKGINLQQISVN